MSVLVVICHLSFVICHLSFVICHLSFVIFCCVWIWRFVACWFVFRHLAAVVAWKCGRWIGGRRNPPQCWRRCCRPHAPTVSLPCPEQSNPTSERPSTLHRRVFPRAYILPASQN